MQDELFKQKLSEVAEWHIPKTLSDTNSSVPKRRPKQSRKIEPEPETEPEQVTAEIDPEQDQEQQEEQDLPESIPPDVNPTYAPQLLKTKCMNVTCEDCGKVCSEGRRLDLTLTKKRNGKGIWRKKCQSCNRFQNPYTGEYTLTGSSACVKWNDFLADKPYVERGPYKKKIIVNTQTATEVIDNGDSIIRIYSKDKSTV